MGNLRNYDKERDSFESFLNDKSIKYENYFKDFKIMTKYVHIRYRHITGAVSFYFAVSHSVGDILKDRMLEEFDNLNCISNVKIQRYNSQVSKGFEVSFYVEGINDIRKVIEIIEDHLGVYYEMLYVK